MTTQPAEVRTVRIIWFAMVVTLAMYGVILAAMQRSWEITERTAAELLHAPLVLPLAAVALGTLVMAFVMPAVLRKRGVPMRTWMIVQWALIEAVAIYGLMASFLVRDLRPYYVAGAIALVAYIATFPTDERTMTV